MEDWLDVWRQDCDTVGLAEPSTDLIEIKRAYAKTLRRTRPDDDAQAYQALREAYDRLVAHARWREAQGGVINKDAPVPAPASAPVAEREPKPDPDPERALAPEAPEASIDVEAWRSPEALCEWLIGVRGRGPVQLKAVIPELREALHALPLSAMDEASVRFAHLLLSTHAELPGDMIELLREHFRWEADFRAERLLGHEVFAALVELLRDIPRPVSDPALVREFAPIITTARLAGSPHAKDRWMATLLTVLMGFALQVQLQRAGPEWLRRLGADLADQRAMAGIAKRVSVIQMILLPLILVAWMIDGLRLRDVLPVTFGMVVMLPLSVVAVDTVLTTVAGWRRRVAASPLGRLRFPGMPHAWSWIGLLVVVASGVAGHFIGRSDDLDTVMFPLTFVAAFIGAVMVLPEDLPTGYTQTLLFAYLASTLHATQSLELVVLAAWVFAGPMVLRSGLYHPQHEWTLHPGRIRGGWPAMAVLMTAGLPVLSTWLASAVGMRLTFGAMALAAVLSVVMPGVPLEEMDLMPRALWSFGLLWVCGATLHAMQRAGWHLGLRLLRGRQVEADLYGTT